MEKEMSMEINDDVQLSDEVSMLWERYNEAEDEQERARERASQARQELLAQLVAESGLEVGSHVTIGGTTPAFVHSFRLWTPTFSHQPQRPELSVRYQKRKKNGEPFKDPQGGGFSNSGSTAWTAGWPEEAEDRG